MKAGVILNSMLSKASLSKERTTRTSRKRVFQTEETNTEALRQEHACSAQGIAQESVGLVQNKGKGEC